MSRGGEGADTRGGVAFPYSLAGFVFTAWFNDRVRRLHHPVVWVGTTMARVIELHADGRLEVETETEGRGPQRHFVPFHASHLERFLLKYAALGAGAGHRPGP